MKGPGQGADSGGDSNVAERPTDQTHFYDRT
jgi:hypothetical protein